MAIVQISQIKHRRGTNENLPQLASAELGWSVDTQQLYIGNGTLEEGAPEIGNTEILTALSAAKGQIPGLPAAGTITMTDNTSADIRSYDNDGQFYPGIIWNYTIVRNTDVRNGYLRISQAQGVVAYDEEYTETNDIGVTFTVTGNVTNNTAVVSYSTTSTGYDATMKYTFGNVAF